MVSLRNAKQDKRPHPRPECESTNTPQQRYNSGISPNVPNTRLLPIPGRFRKLLSILMRVLVKKLNSGIPLILRLPCRVREGRAGAAVMGA